MTAPGDLFADRYRTERLLARGGMGNVWVARDERLARTVAIKFMDPQFASSEELQARFKREASAAGSLRTRHVVQVHDFGVEDEVPYIVMELLEGEDLGARLSRVRRLSITDAAGLITQIARGLRHAHEAGIIHRDLKPQNLMLCREDDGEIVKILDFGVAKRTLPMQGGLGDATTTKELLGSPQYMSPEQTRGRGDIDHRSDLWALGVIAYRMLTGKIPFDSENMVDLIVRIQSEGHPLASSIDPSLEPLDAFFAKALAKDPTYRFATAPELASALASYAPGDVGRPSALDPTPPPIPLLGPYAASHAAPPAGQRAQGSLEAVPRLPSSPGRDHASGDPEGTPAPTPAPRSGALPPSVFGVSPPSLMPARSQRVSPAMAIAVSVSGAFVIALLLVLAAMRGGDDPPAPAASLGGPGLTAGPMRAASPGLPSEQPSEQPSQQPSQQPSEKPSQQPSDPAPSDEPASPGAPDAASALEVPSPGGDPAASTSGARSPASSAPSASASPARRGPGGAKSPPPRSSGEKKLLLTY